MTKHPFSKLQSSLSLEELLDQPRTHDSKNWMLTYLDVFVLIIMLVITLVTLNDIKVEQQAAIKPPAAKPKTVCPPIVKPTVTICPPPAVAEPQKQVEVAEHAVEPQPIIATPKPNESTVTPPAPISTADTKSAAEAAPKPESKPEANQSINNTTDENKLQQQLTKTIDEFGLNKAVNIKVTQGYAQLEIQDKVLFKSSEAKLTTSGENLIKRLTPLLQQAVGLIFIEGHTDNIPIKTPQFPSNWELGSARAASVLHFLVSQQLDSNRLRAISYADTMPIADNSTPEGREKNRRVNILIKFSER